MSHHQGLIMRNHQLEFGIEPLEQRRLLAGNVTAAINGAGDVIISGDNNDNSIEIARNNGTTQLQIRTSDLTTSVNGGAPGVTQFLDYAGVELRNLKINMRGGNDVVLISTNGLNFDKGIVKLGSGNDRVTTSQTNFENLKIALGSGIRDEGTAGGGWDQSANIGPGTNAGNVVVRGSSTEDVVRFDSATVERTNIKLSGNEDGFITNATTFEDDFNLNLGSGDDLLNVRAANALGRFVINAGADVDSQFAFGGQFALDPVVKSVEQIF